MGTQNEVFDAEVMGEQLKKLRKKVKLSQEKFAERMGMSKDTIYNYEKGKTAIPHDLIKRLCQEFNVSADYFYFETDKPLVEDNTISITDAFTKELSKLDEFDEEVIRYLIDYVLVYDNEHIEIRWNFDDFQAG